MPFYLQPPVSSTSTRKSFLAKLGGLVAAVGIMPRAVLKAGVRTPASGGVKVAIQPDNRAVARRPDSL